MRSEIARAEKAVHRALAANDSDRAIEALEELSERDRIDAQTTGRKIQAVRRVIDAAKRQSPIVERVARADEVLLLEHQGSYQVAAHRLDELLRLEQQSPELLIAYRYRLEELRMRLLYLSGQDSEVIEAANGFIADHCEGSETERIRTVHATWLRHFAERRLLAAGSVQDPQPQAVPLPSEPSRPGRWVQLRGTWAALETAVRAEDALGVLDALADMESLFELEADLDLKLEMAPALLMASEWMWGDWGAFLAPAAIPRSRHLADVVINALGDIDTERAVALLAEARWYRVRASGPDDDLERAQAILEDLSEMGPPAIEFMDEILRRMGTPTSPSGRVRYAIAASVRASALVEADREDEALAFVKATIRRFSRDSEPAVQAVVSAMRELQDELSDRDH